MKKTRIHGEIKNKFIIKDISTNKIVQENIQEEGYLCLINYPAIFNTEDDANKYLEHFDISEEELSNLRIENTDISFFDKGGILIEMED